MFKANLAFIIATLLFSNAFASDYYSGGTHYVEGYSRSDGTYVEGHEAGNPGSGIHCHDSVCE